ncbi:hypothetical protein Pla175_38720 [Pirellulimonas nuda]|uniref:DUF3500 domain-containing protein n=1 Tax=Pirellulimonas nuda TaxID=2528009 RepID=A0A518DG63_9BACT|nr:DUF3500 domain-containing protein [Pirellulimonas nuda]QDU90467.1 hypothetical protein Pla175_38720 [Pirellulimonas nuda]
MTTFRTNSVAIALLLAAAWSARTACGESGVAAAAPAAEAGAPTAKIVSAADLFLDALEEPQRSKTVYKFDDDAQRARWSNLPVGMVPRGGISMGELSPEQRGAAMDLLKAALSKQGYEKVMQIVEADEVLKYNQRGRGGSRGGGANSGPRFGRDNFFISFLGEPSVTEPWMIQFGGHHLALNMTLAGEQGTLAPSHTAAQPASYEMQGKAIRPLGNEVEKAVALMASLDEAQRKQAVLGFRVRNLVLGPGRDGQMIEPEGLKGDQLNEDQRRMLLDLASEWTGIINEPTAAAKLEEMEKNVAETWFAWSGSAEEGSVGYFRIQGPTVFIEFAPQGQGEAGLNHLHTIYRDPTNEYGARWWRKHD